MSKVKITQEQADAIEELFTVVGYTHEAIIRIHAVSPNDWIGVGKPLNSMPLLDLVDSLRIGYDVVPEFGVGDWVVHENGHSIRQVISVSDCYLKVSGGEDRYIWDKPFVRHATPEEIAKEKGCRWWYDRNRGVWELRARDILKHKSGGELSEVKSVNNSEYLIGEWTYYQSKEDVKKYYTVVCLAENRDDVSDDV